MVWGGHMRVRTWCLQSFSMEHRVLPKWCEETRLGDNVAVSLLLMFRNYYHSKTPGIPRGMNMALFCCEWSPNLHEERKNCHRIHIGRTWTKIWHSRNVKKWATAWLGGSERVCRQMRPLKEHFQTAAPHISRELRDFSLEGRTTTELKL